MNDSLLIKKALLQDAGILISLTAQLGYLCTKEKIEEGIIPYKNKFHGVVFVAVLAGTVFGWISLNIVRYFYVQPFIEVSGFVVDEKIRNKGLGKKLLEAAEEQVKEEGYMFIRIRTDVKDRGS